MARDPRTPDCQIKGCTRAAGRSGLCTSHHKLVPMSMTMDLSVAIMRASHELAQRHHRKWVRFVQAALRDGTAVERPAGYMAAAHALGMAVARGKG